MRLILLILSYVIAFQLHSDSRELLVYIGTYTKTEEQGIHWLKLDMGTGKLTASGKLSGQKNPSFLAIHPNKKFLYAVTALSNISFFN